MKRGDYANVPDHDGDPGELTDALSALANLFSDSMFAFQLGGHMTCHEAEVLADVLDAAGYPKTAAFWLESHGESDDHEDEHYLGDAEEIEREPLTRERVLYNLHDSDCPMPFAMLRNNLEADAKELRELLVALQAEGLTDIDHGHGWYRRRPKDDIKDRLEYLRGEIEAERISYGEIAELQALADHIEDGDVLLLEWAGVPEEQAKREGRI